MCNSSRKKAFEERASDENKEKEAGGRGWQEGGGADLGAGQAFISVHRLLPFLVSLSHFWVRGVCCEGAE